MAEKIRIYLADDHQVLIDGLITVLKTNANLDVIGCSLSGENLVEDVKNKNADILIMDINMPGKDGLEVLNEFNDKGYNCNVIIFSSFDDLKLIKKVLQLGAKGYLTKESAGENIIDAIHSVYKGEEYYSKSVRDKIFLSFTNKSKQNSNVFNLVTPVSITDRKLEILKLISMEYSGKEISEALYISSNTVETHRKNLLKKLNTKTTVGLVKYALKNNLITN